MKAHPIADLFPMMSDAELQELADDIKRNGLREPIVVDDEEWLKAHPKPTARGRNGHLKVREWNKAYERAIDDGEILIVDGRNRYTACRLAGIGYDYDDSTDGITIEHRPFGWDDLRGCGEGEIVDFVLSKNIHRRHLTASQRAMLAADIANMKQGTRTDLVETSTKSQSQAAELCSVSRESVITATKVKENGAPELQQAVRAGKVSVSTAAVIATEPEEMQREIVAKGDPVAAAKEIKKRKAKPIPSAPTGPDVESWTRKGVAEGFCDAETAERIVERAKAKNPTTPSEAKKAGEHYAEVDGKPVAPEYAAFMLRAGTVIELAELEAPPADENSIAMARAAAEAWAKVAEKMAPGDKPPAIGPEMIATFRAHLEDCSDVRLLKQVCDELKALKLDIAELQIRTERKIGELLPPKAKRDTKRKKGAAEVAPSNDARPDNCNR